MRLSKTGQIGNISLNGRSDAQYDQQCTALLQRTRAQGAAQGITSEADVERMCDEYRQSKQA